MSLEWGSDGRLHLRRGIQGGGGGGLDFADQQQLMHEEYGRKERYADIRASSDLNRTKLDFNAAKLKSDTDWATAKLRDANPFIDTRTGQLAAEPGGSVIPDQTSDNPILNTQTGEPVAELAQGGQVQAGREYLVGERGPELLRMGLPQYMRRSEYIKMLQAQSRAQGGVDRARAANEPKLRQIDMATAMEMRTRNLDAFNARVDAVYGKYDPKTKATEVPPHIEKFKAIYAPQAGDDLGGALENLKKGVALQQLVSSYTDNDARINEVTKRFTLTPETRAALKAGHPEAILKVEGQVFQNPAVRGLHPGLLTGEGPPQPSQPGGRPGEAVKTNPDTGDRYMETLTPEPAAPGGYLRSTRLLPPAPKPEPAISLRQVAPVPPGQGAAPVGEVIPLRQLGPSAGGGGGWGDQTPPDPAIENWKKYGGAVVNYLQDQDRAAGRSLRDFAQGGLEVAKGFNRGLRQVVPGASRVINEEGVVGWPAPAQEEKPKPPPVM